MKKIYLPLLIFSVGALTGQSDFYDLNKIQKISIVFNQTNWDYMLDTAKAGADGYIPASKVTINDRTFDNVGVKYKGNSSYDSTLLKNPIHIELNTYKEQDLDGYKDIKLSNGYADPSFVREALSYKILSNYMEAPRSNFAQLFINGKYIGLYTNSESVNKDFCANHFYKKEEVFVKGNPGLKPSPTTKSNLKFLGSDSSLYKNFYELKSDHGWNALRALCDTVTNYPQRLPQVFDLDQCLWMLAFNSILVNLDSYSGVFAQNFYLYKGSKGVFNPIIWDLNMSFGAFPFAGNSNSSMGSLSLNSLATVPLGIHANDGYWPLIKAVNGHASWKRRYIAHARTIAEEFFTDSTYIKEYLTLVGLIDTSVKSDPGKFFSYPEFQTSLTKEVSIGTYSVPGIQQLMDARISYLFSKTEFTAAAPTITASTPLNNSGTIWISCLVQNASTVELNYRFNASASFTALPMFDDGQHQDGNSGDGIFGNSIVSPGLNLHYYVYAENDLAGVYSPRRAAKEYFTFNRYPLPSKGQLVINEILADNKDDVRNEFHSTEDWIELLNLSSDTLSLEDCYLSDDPGNRALYAFPKNASVQPGERITVWADEFGNGKQFHANFKLKETGDAVILSNGSQLVMDQIFFSEQSSDVSLARCPDGTGDFYFSNKPSYGLVNCVVGLNEQKRSSDHLVYPNPAVEHLNIKSFSNEEKNVQLLDMNGRVLFNSKFISELIIDLTGIKPGIYLVKVGDRTEKIAIVK